VPVQRDKKAPVQSLKRRGRQSGGSRPAGRRPSKKTLMGVLSVNARGFGFVTVPDGKDIFIPLENLSTGMDGDTVSTEIIREVPGKKRVGRILKVIEPSQSDIVGIFHKKGDAAYVVPNDERITRPLEIAPDRLKPERSRLDARGKGRKPKEGELVVVRRDAWDDPSKNPLGRIVEILGDPNDPGMDRCIVAKSKGLRIAFPKAVQDAVKKLSAPNMRTERKRREDLRDWMCFTIDSESAQDFDDAVSLVQLDNGLFELGVHIADVSHYVREGSALDKEALERGTSVYFVDEVIPMLPEKLSNDLCSLKEKKDRFTFSVIMLIDSRGTVRDYRITESIIRSRKRFTYQEVEEIIQGREDPHGKTIHLMMMLSLVLRRAREEMGSIDFDVPVPVISLDANGIPYEVRPSERRDANRLIEEFMLAANRTVARHMAGSARVRSGDGKGKPPPFIYRVHEKPDENEARAFLDLLARLGIQYKIPGDLVPDDFRKILDIIENLDFKAFAEKVALRSMTKAVYSTENIGHFGLAFDAYTHFTSPIRRYPDLIVHRLLKKYLTGSSPGGFPSVKALEKICEACSRLESRAIDAEREYTKIKAMRFLSGKVGGTYKGVIAGITSFGIFVELTHYLIEGLVHISEMKDDRYVFDKDNYTLTGKSKGKVYRLGDRVQVTIKNVSMEERKANFTLNGIIEST